jgi:cytochrome c553
MKAWTMKPTRFKIAVLAILASAVPALALELGSSTVRNCTWCHGSGAQGYFPAPRLAGQRAPYIQSQLVDFRAHTRDNPFSRQYMWGAVEGLDSRTARDLALYFATLPPIAANDGLPEFAGSGETIYQQGMPEANIVACVVCHGPNGEGVGAIPRLGGLGYVYLKKRLEQWGEGYHASAKPPMPRIAARLSEQQIVELASYLSFLQ